MISTPTISETERIMLEYLGESLKSSDNACEIPELSNKEWERIYYIANRHEVSVLMGDIFNSVNLSVKTKNDFQLKTARTVHKGIRLQSLNSQSINQSLQIFRYSETPNLTDRPTDGKLQNILDNCELDIFSENIRIMITQAVERLYYTETLKVGDARLPQDKVRSYLNLLTSEVIISVLQAMKNNEERIVNPMAYLMSTIINTICEQESDLILSLPKEYVNESDFYAPYPTFGSEGDDLDGTT